MVSLLPGRFDFFATFMARKRKQPINRWKNASRIQRANKADAAPHDATSSHSLSSSSSTTAASSDWGQLPIELLVLIAGYASFRVLIRLALMNRRLYGMVGPSSSVTGHGSMWREYPPMTVIAEERPRRTKHTNLRHMWIGGERFGCTSHSLEYMSSLLLVLRHITELHFGFERFDNDTPMPVALFESLQHFQLLQTLELRGDMQIPADTLVTGLYTLPSLTCLDLNCYDEWGDEELVPALRHLCTSQLRCASRASTRVARIPAPRSHDSPALADCLSWRPLPCACAGRRPRG